MTIALKRQVSQHAFPTKPYVTLEDIEIRQYALTDPKDFLKQYPNGALIDEIQYAPDLLSYIQVIVDATPQNGLFILTGSQQFSLMAGVSQSLAGRTALVTLLPLDCKEYPQALHQDITETMYSGFYPRTIGQNLNPTEAASFYLRTYVERDIRQLLNVQDLAQFERFLKFCAGRSGQMLNLSALSNDSGLALNTIRKWLSVLETSYIITVLPAAYDNINKRLVKTGKLYFLDTGLLCYLLGITHHQQLRNHPLKGQVFETLVVSDCYKQRYHHAQDPKLAYYRDQQHEVDLIDEHGPAPHAIEIKSGATFSPDFTKSLRYYKKHHPQTTSQTLLYGGDMGRSISGIRVRPFRELGQLLDTPDTPVN
jgi:predicted AAA+ superfamily ATPase